MSKQLRLNFMFTCLGKLFIAGNTAKGVLKVYTLNETNIKCIKIGIIGKIRIEADESENSNTIDEVFYSSEEHIFGPSDLINNDEYDEKLLEYAVPLANNLPPSIMINGGSITYQLYATMEEEFSDGTTQQVNTQANVSVASLVDCNTIPKASKEKRSYSTPTNRCVCLRANENNDSLQISPRAYVSGDCIKINAEIFNANSSPICYVQVALVQKVKLKYEEHNMKLQRVVSETKRGCVMPEEVQVWRGDLLRLPPLPATTYHKHLHVSYKIKLIPVRQNIDVSAAKAVLSVPVVIGNLPLESTLFSFKPMTACETLGNQVLPIPKPYQEYAKAENCIIQNPEDSKYVPSYISYVTERAMENVELH